MDVNFVPPLLRPVGLNLFGEEHLGVRLALCVQALRQLGVRYGKRVKGYVADITARKGGDVLFVEVSVILERISDVRLVHQQAFLIITIFTSENVVRFFPLRRCGDNEFFGVLSPQEILDISVISFGVGVLRSARSVLQRDFTIRFVGVQNYLSARGECHVDGCPPRRLAVRPIVV